MNYYVYETDFGNICICENHGAISHVLFGTTPPDMRARKQDGAAVAFLDYRETLLIERAALQLSQYLTGRRTDFDLPLDPEGTQFQKKVWQVMQSIPYGNTVSSRKLAKVLGTPSSTRAVSVAGEKNPISILIPAHRVIEPDTADECDTDIKKSLMALETTAMRHWANRRRTATSATRATAAR